MVADVLDYNFVVSEFTLQSCYYGHVWLGFMAYKPLLVI